MFATHTLRDAHARGSQDATHEIEVSNRTTTGEKHMCRHMVVFMLATSHKHSSWNAFTITTTHAQTCTGHATHHPRTAEIDPPHTDHNPTHPALRHQATRHSGTHDTAGALSLSHTHTARCGGMKASTQCGAASQQATANTHPEHPHNAMHKSSELSMSHFTRVDQP